ncbi:MAG: hypothetical protein OXU20_24535 [Myxococcales bacterium]|nr:hypothetical protein [Myxococcales bacterium]
MTTTGAVTQSAKNGLRRAIATYDLQRVRRIPFRDPNRTAPASQDDAPKNGFEDRPGRRYSPAPTPLTRDAPEWAPLRGTPGLNGFLNGHG